jgi:hypothetical protein
VWRGWEHVGLGWGWAVGKESAIATVVILKHHCGNSNRDLVLVSPSCGQIRMNRTMTYVYVYIYINMLIYLCTYTYTCICMYDPALTEGDPSPLKS